MKKVSLKAPDKTLMPWQPLRAGCPLTKLDISDSMGEWSSRCARDPESCLGRRDHPSARALRVLEEGHGQAGSSDCSIHHHSLCFPHPAQPATELLGCSLWLEVVACIS